MGIEVKEIVAIWGLAGAAYCWGSGRLEGIFTLVAGVRGDCILK